MRARSTWSLLPLLLTALLTGCQQGTGPGTTLELPEPPNLTAAVFQSTHESGNFPDGYVSQYAVWIGAPGAASPSAGLLVAAARRYMSGRNGTLAKATAAAIRPGDLIEVWRDASVSYGAVQAPPGQPCFIGRQVVIVR